MLSDLLGASALKGTSNTLGNDNSSLVKEIRSALSLRVMQSRRVLSDAMETMRFVKEEIPNPEFGIILGALSKSLGNLDALDVEDSINIMSTQISDYLEVDENGIFLDR